VTEAAPAELFEDAVPDRAQLREHLVAARIAGAVDTPRDNNLRNFRFLSERNPGFMFGLSFDGRWNATDIFELMVARCGIDPDPRHIDGPDTIDPDLTIDALERFADRLAVAAERGQRVVVATGHPGGVLAIHAEVARALARAGCTLLTPAAGATVEEWRSWGTEVRDLRYVNGVAMLHSGAELRHTHSPVPMQMILAALAEDGQPPPDLVVADHGWAGAAGEAGIDAIGYADCNDPALFVGEAEGKVLVSVPLDDNVAPHLYAPLTAYVLQRAGLGSSAR
jgi:Phosphatase